MAAGTWRDVAATRRVLVHGVTGSGKSTLASQLGSVLDLPVTLVERETMRAWHADPSAPPVVLLARPRDADELVAMLQT